MATEDIDAGSRVLEVPENIILLWVLLFLIASLARFRFFIVNKNKEIK